MSTYLYLTCKEHDPKLYSEDVGQHLYDLPRIREEVERRKDLASIADLCPSWNSHFTNNAVRFFVEHPNCELGIVSEYGVEYPLVAEDGGGVIVCDTEEQDE